MARRRVLMEPFTRTSARTRTYGAPLVTGPSTVSSTTAGSTWCATCCGSALHGRPAFLGIDDDADRETMKRFSIAHTVNAFDGPRLSNGWKSPIP